MDNPPQPRRVATAPSVPTAPSPSGSKDPGSELVETFYTHPNVKITAFTSSQKINPSTGLPFQDEPGTLSPSSAMERTIAVGPFRIYRAPGSVAFLSCGSALQPILPRSQVWCIDEDSSQFILQIRRPQYWRIELPVEELEDEERALLLRDVFDKILHFEKSPCPFKRDFTVELPEEPITPIKKKAWTAEGKNLRSTHFSSDFSSPPSGPNSLRKATESPTWSRRNGGASLHKGGDSNASSSERSDSRGSTRDMSDVSFSSFGNDEVDLDRFTSLKLDSSPGSDRPGSRSHRPVPELVDEYHTISAHARATMLPDSHPLKPWEAPPGQAQDAVDDDAINEEYEIGSIGSVGSDTFEGSGHVAPVNLDRRRKTRMLAGRAFTAPSHLNLVANTPSRPQDKSAAHRHSSTARHGSTTRHGSSRASTPSTEATITSGAARKTPPAHVSNPPRTQPTARAPKLGQGLNTMLDESKPKPKPKESPSSGSTSTAVHTNPAVSQAANPAVVRHRSRPGNGSISRRALSPFPAGANLFVPPPPQPTPPAKPASPKVPVSPAVPSSPAFQTSRGRLDLVRRLPQTIIHKTVEYFLGPPTYLIRLMLHVAAKIMAGDLHGLVYGFDEEGERIPVQWDYSDSEFSDWEEDDELVYGQGEGLQKLRSHTPSVRNTSKSGSSSNQPRRSKTPKPLEVD